MAALNHDSGMGVTSVVEGQGTLPSMAASEIAPEFSAGSCPSIDQLWPAAVGESPLPSVAAHLPGCGDCQRRTAQLASEIGEARRVLTERSHSDGPLPAETPDAAGRTDAQVTEGDRLLARWNPASPATRPMAVIGKYFVLETICASGQATVFRGLHPSLLVDVVIKLAHRPWRENETGRARLVSEARALAEIVHPHLARLYDLDFCDERPFLVLEYVRGRHLGQFRESTELDPSQIAFLVAKIARAVAAAHERGILHLDLKPENVLVTPDGEPVLIDFGLSFLSCSAESRSEGGRFVAGTPQYMAPEQTVGDRESLTQRTDVFGLGGVLFYLCTGRDPFVVRSVDGRLQRSEEPEWGLLLRADVPARLKSICRKALSLRPQARYSTAESLAEVLENVGRRWSGRALRRLRRIAAALFILGNGCLAGALFVRADPQLNGASLAARVARVGHELPLPDALPLHVSDQLRINGSVDQASHVAMLAVDETRKIQWLRPYRMSPDGAAIRIAYPEFSTSVPVCGNMGRVLILLVGRRDEPIHRRDAAELICSPSLFASVPDRVSVTFDRRRCEISVRPGVSITDSQRTTLNQQVQELQLQLADRFDDFAGILAATTDGGVK